MINKYKYLYRFNLGEQVVAETYGIRNATSVYAAFAPQIKEAVSLSVYLQVEHTPAGNVAEALSTIITRIESINAKEKEKEETK